MGRKAAKFYEQFLASIYENTEKLGWNKSLAEFEDKEWTKLMDELLNEVFIELYGKKAMKEKEPIIVGRQRYDFGIFGKNKVLLEHENILIHKQLNKKTKKWTKGNNEVSKIIKGNPHLGVFITYARNIDWPCEYFADKILKDLIKYSFEGQFLLIIGSQLMLSPSDWFAYDIDASTEKKKILLHPSEVDLIPFDDSKKIVKKAKTKTKIKKSTTGSFDLSRSGPLNKEEKAYLRKLAKKQDAAGFLDPASKNFKHPKLFEKKKQKKN